MTTLNMSIDVTEVSFLPGWIPIYVVFGLLLISYLNIYITERRIKKQWKKLQ